MYNVLPKLHGKDVRKKKRESLMSGMVSTNLVGRIRLGLHVEDHEMQPSLAIQHRDELTTRSSALKPVRYLSSVIEGLKVLKDDIPLCKR